MARQMVMTILGLVLASVCAARPVLAQTQAGTTTGADQSVDQPSAADMAREATNPFSSGWLMQIQQNNNWTELPLDRGRRMQSNLMFQPLVSLRLTEAWGLYLRPVATIFNSQPHLDKDGGPDRTTGFGDTVLGVAAAHPLLGGRLIVGGGPTFVFPTASRRQLGQDTWQAGPDLGVTLLGKSFIAYAFAQQWFKVGGDGRKTSQLNTVFNFTHAFASGWTIGTQPNLSVDWEAPEGDGVALSVGPQVGKMCKCGRTPTLFQVQLQYYPVRPNDGGPRWDVQLQVTPTISALVKRTLF